MKRLLVLWICLLATAAPHASASTQPSTIEGSWEGTLQVGATRLRIVFHLEAVGKENLTGTMDSPDQGARGIPLSSVGVGSDTLHIEVRVVGGQYAGVLQQGDSVIVGVWSQGGLQLPPLRSLTSSCPQPDTRRAFHLVVTSSSRRAEANRGPIR